MNDGGIENEVRGEWSRGMSGKKVEDEKERDDGEKENWN